jgi:hypothetical protein
VACEYFQDEQTKCLHCGCFLIAKCQLAQEFCPIGKWSAIVPARSSGCGGCGNAAGGR